MRVQFACMHMCAFSNSISTGRLVRISSALTQYRLWGIRINFRTISINVVWFLSLYETSMSRSNEIYWLKFVDLKIWHSHSFLFLRINFILNLRGLRKNSIYILYGCDLFGFSLKIVYLRKYKAFTSSGSNVWPCSIQTSYILAFILGEKQRSRMIRHVLAS